MRRFFKLLAITVAAGLLLAIFTIFQAHVCFEGADSYTFFIGNTSKDCKEVRAENCLALKKLTLGNVCGECAEYKSFDIEKYLASVNGKIVFCEKLSDSVNYYCEADLPYSVTLGGRKINLHVCVKDDGVKVASPIIFGGY